MRRWAIDGPKKREIALLEEKAAAATGLQKQAYLLEIEDLRARMCATWLDPIDLRFRNRIREPQPRHKAVAFWLMDTSGSMDEDQKNDAKLFFTLKLMLLQQHHDKVEIVPIRYNNTARECSREEFFNATDTGENNLLSAMELMDEIIQKRYSPEEWEIFGSLMSDGDQDWRDVEALEIFETSILPVCRYFTYVELCPEENSLSELFKPLTERFSNFVTRLCSSRSDLVPIFMDLFRKEKLRAETNLQRHLSWQPT